MKKTRKPHPDFPMPITGVGVMIFKGDKVLLGKRKSAHGAGTYEFPGGKLEVYETFEECARRETKEECDIEIKNVRVQYFGNLQHYLPRQYTHIGMVAEWKSGTPKVMEPNKCDGWDWYPLSKLPKPYFKGVTLALQAMKNGSTYFDSKKWKKIGGLL